MPITILLIQPDERLETRTYSTYNSVDDCMLAVCMMYEEHLRQFHLPPIIYDVCLLFDFLDLIFDIGCLVLEETTLTYTPYNRTWIKERVYDLLYPTPIV